MAAYETRFKGANVVLIEPQRDDYLMFFTNIFGFAERQAVCEYAYQATRRDLLARFDELAPIFARHGVTLRRDVLEEKRNLWEQVKLDRDRVKMATSPNATVRRLDDALNRLEQLLAAKQDEEDDPAITLPVVPPHEEPLAVN